MYKGKYFSCGYLLPPDSRIRSAFIANDSYPFMSPAFLFTICPTNTMLIRTGTIDSEINSQNQTDNGFKFSKKLQLIGQHAL